MEDDEFASFVHAVERRTSVASGSTQEAAGREMARPTTARHKAHAKPLLASIPKIVWLVVGCMIVFGLIFWLYYSRRKQTTAKKKEDMVAVMAKNLKELGDEIQVISQKQNNMGMHLRNVANHSKSVEQGLSQALGDWTKTFDDLREEIGDRGDGVEREEAEEEDGRGAAYDDDEEEEEDEDEEEEGQ